MTIIVEDGAADGGGDGSDDCDCYYYSIDEVNRCRLVVMMEAFQGILTINSSIIHSESSIESVQRLHRHMLCTSRVNSTTHLRIIGLPRITYV